MFFTNEKTYDNVSGEIYSITASNIVWLKWKIVFQKHKMGDLIDLNIGMLFNLGSHFKQMKRLVREFFRIFQGLTEAEMGNVLKTKTRDWFPIWDYKLQKHSSMFG